MVTIQQLTNNNTHTSLLRHVSILTDHHQGVGLYLKVTELFKKHWI